MELFDKLLIFRIFCYCQGLWATPQFLISNDFVQTFHKVFFHEMEQFWGLNLKKIMISENKHFKSHPNGYTRVSVFGHVNWTNNWCELYVHH